MKKITTAVLFAAISLAPVFAGQASTTSSSSTSSTSSSQTKPMTKKHRKHHSKKSVTQSTMPESAKK